MHALGDYAPMYGDKPENSDNYAPRMCQNVQVYLHTKARIPAHHRMPALLNLTKPRSKVTWTPKATKAKPDQN